MIFPEKDVELKVTNLTPESWLADKGYDINKMLLVETRKAHENEGGSRVCLALSLVKFMQDYARAVVEEIEK